MEKFIDRIKNFRYSSVCLVLLAVFLFAGCGGEGTGSFYDLFDGSGVLPDPAEICFREIDYWDKDAGDLAIDNLVGSYTMTGFSLEFYDEFMNPDGTLTEAMVSSWAGTMTVTPSFASQTIDLEGEIVVVADNYTFTPIDATHGTMHLITEVRDLPITINGNELVTDTGVLCLSDLQVGMISSETGDPYFGGVTGVVLGQ